MSIDAEYISAGCNRCPKPLDWGGNEHQLAFAFSNSIAVLSNREPFQIQITLNKHTNQVNCVRWLVNLSQNSYDFNEFVSGSVDKSLVVWRGKHYEYEPIDVLNGHTDSVFICDAIYHHDTTLVCSSSADSSVRLWLREEINKKFECVQSIMSKSKGFALALKLFNMPFLNIPGLLIGFENHKIELYSHNGETKQFTHLNTLLGHEDWIRDLDVCTSQPNQILITSCSQDTYIRIWKLNASKIDKREENDSGAKNLIKNLDNEDDDDVVPSSSEITLKSVTFNVDLDAKHQVKYELNLESVLYGHDDWIYSVKWAPKRSPDSAQPLVLVSASIDRTVVLWKYDEVNSLWLDTVRIGDIGGNNLGFYGGLFSPDGQYIVAHGFQGALYLWRRHCDESKSSSNETLVPAVISSGHFDLVEDVCWDKSQNYLLSVSKDQTARFHGHWKRENVWCEMGRPQMHGYDLKCIASIENNKFVSGADEKILRVFSAPRVFLENYFKLSEDKQVHELLNSVVNDLPQGASVPALGLSNKAIFNIVQEDACAQKESVRIVDELYKELEFNVVELSQPPSEEHLMQNTLWPEIQKLYGHGFEVFSCAIHPSGTLIASACKATKAKYAEIILWKLKEKSYRQVSTLSGHELTIVQMSFSNNGDYLLSVSRDRTWCLFKKRASDEINYELFKKISTSNPIHTRIVWSCAWSFDDKYFATTSRDKKLAIWSVDGDTALATYEGCESITACSIASHFIHENKYLIALGYDNGELELVEWHTDWSYFNRISRVISKIAHHKTITRLAFRRKSNSYDTSLVQLASSSYDHSVRIFQIKF